MTTDALKLAAFDEEDLAVLSTHLQDALLTVGDLTYLKRAKRFVAVVNRFAWERLIDGRPPAEEGRFERRRTGLHFERVLGVRTRGIDRAAPDTILELLAIRFLPGEPPAGTVELVFAGGKDIRLEVECLEAASADLGPSWATPRCPSHPDTPERR